MNVLFIMEIREDVRKHLAEELEGANVNLMFPEDISDEALMKLAPSAHIMVGWKPTKEILLAGKRLKMFMVPWAGVQNTIEVLREANEVRKIPMVNSHDNAYPTAQHGVALLLALMNKVVHHHIWTTEGKWRQEEEGGVVSTTLRGRNIGLLGYGHVNRQIHKFLSCFDVSFSVLKRSWNEEETPTEITRYTPEDLHGFLETVDILIIAVPETPETNGLIRERELGLLGREGLLVNIARGKVVEQEALYDALKNNTIAGAAIDVWYDYRPEEDEQGRKYPYALPFHELDNIVLSPHRSASPYDSLDKWKTNIENLRRVAEGRTDFISLVDLERGY